MWWQMRFQDHQDTKINAMTTTIHSDESSGQLMIDIIDNSINTFKNQLILKEGEEYYKLENLFPSYQRHVIRRTAFTEKIL